MTFLKIKKADAELKNSKCTVKNCLNLTLRSSADAPKPTKEIIMFEKLEEYRLRDFCSILRKFGACADLSLVPLIENLVLKKPNLLKKNESELALVKKSPASDLTVNSTIDPKFVDKEPLKNDSGKGAPLEMTTQDLLSSNLYLF